MYNYIYLCMNGASISNFALGLKSQEPLVIHTYNHRINVYYYTRTKAAPSRTIYYTSRLNNTLIDLS
jgi:hypothetical protein